MFIFILIAPEGNTSIFMLMYRLITTINSEDLEMAIAPILLSLFVI